MYKRQAQARGELQSRLLASGSRLALTTEASDRWWWLMEHPDANAARLLRVALDDPTLKDDLPRLVAGLLARQREGAWATTTANVWGVLALRSFAARHESQPVEGRTVASLGAARVERSWAVAAASAASAAERPPALQLAWPAAAAAAAPAMLSVQHQGSGRPWLTVQSLAAVPLEAPVVAGYRLRRTVTPVEVREAGRLSRGDVVQVTLEIDATEARTWVALSDPLPPGATVLGSGLGGESKVATMRPEGRPNGSASPSLEAMKPSPAYIERLPDQWRAYFDELPRGRHVVSYRMRLTNAGRFSLPPTRAEALYAPETFGELPLGRLEVQP